MGTVAPAILLATARRFQAATKAQNARLRQTARQPDDPDALRAEANMLDARRDYLDPVDRGFLESIIETSDLLPVRWLPMGQMAASGETLGRSRQSECYPCAAHHEVSDRTASVRSCRKTLNAYHNRAIATQEVIDELIKLAKEMEAAKRRGERLGLNDDEVAFYDALAVNHSAVQVMGDQQLKVIATELVTRVRQSATIDWTLRENARAGIRVLVKRILNKYGYPPDLQEEAVRTVLWRRRRCSARIGRGGSLGRVQGGTEGLAKASCFVYFVYRRSYPRKRSCQ